MFLDKDEVLLELDKDIIVDYYANKYNISKNKVEGIIEKFFKRLQQEQLYTFDSHIFSDYYILSELENK